MNSNNILTNDFAYVVGVIYGDGYCRSRKRGGEITLKVKDKGFALTFKKYLDSFSKLDSRIYRKKDEYFVHLYSKSTADKILSFDINRILKSGDSIKLNFLSGMFDSEGGVIGQNFSNRRFAKRWIHFSNSSIKIINLIKSILNSFEVNYTLKSRIHSGFGSKKLQYEIKLYELKNLIWFYENKIFKIDRKANKLKEVIKSYEKKNIKKAYNELKLSWRGKNG